jgi:ribosomal protein S18 acetylase RimI-like enzyme
MRGLMRLNVYHDNPKALAFYERIGFVAVSDAQYLTLSGAAFETLGEHA